MVVVVAAAAADAFSLLIQILLLLVLLVLLLLIKLLNGSQFPLQTVATNGRTNQGQPEFNKPNGF